jgi:hypothetical protein
MTVLKVITILNWIVVAVLGFLVVADVLTGNRSGGEAAGRGIGQALLYAAMAALGVLIVLNLLPYPWAKFTAFALVALPILFFQMRPAWQLLKRAVGNRLEAIKPIFPDPERDRIARALLDGRPDTVRELLRTPPANLDQNGELLAFAITTINHSGQKPAERLECLRLLFQAGAKLASIDRGPGVPVHFAVADVGNAALLRLLLEQGADANAVHPYAKRHILFEAVGSHQEPEATVKALRDAGAQPNALAKLDDGPGRVTPLWRAVELERWGVSATLIERGADLNFRAANGQTIRSLIDEAAPSFKPNGSATQDDIERLKRLLK